MTASTGPRAPAYSSARRAASASAAGGLATSAVGAQAAAVKAKPTIPIQRQPW
jgi:hypothetical protein